MKEILAVPAIYEGMNLLIAVCNRMNNNDKTIEPQVKERTYDLLLDEVMRLFDKFDESGGPLFSFPFKICTRHPLGYVSYYR